MAAVVALLTVSACSGGGSNNNAAAGMSPARDGIVMGGASGQARAPSAPLGAAAAARDPSGSSLNDIGRAAFDRAQIKTARIELRSKRIASVVANIEQVAATEGGFIDSENTTTDVHGITTSSAITLRVPVDSFEDAVAQVSGLAQLASKRTTTQDVTGRVADVASRVQSAKDAIAQLRVLFNRATKLGDIITLESELQEREADLEALQAQQRALSDEASLSTIAVEVTRPPAVAVKKTQHHEDTSGFFGGLKQGWDALVATADAVAHGVGAVLPIGLSLIALAALLWALGRRVPRRRPHASG